MIYRFDAEKGTLEPNEPPFVKIHPGAGPRHFAFHPEGEFAYVINEIDCTVTAMKYDPKKGELTPIQTISTLPPGTPMQDSYSTAEVVVHPSGKLLFGSNRGHDSIARYTIDPATGKLAFLGTTPTQGKTPRNFAVDPTGTILLAENQETGTIVLFRIDAATGNLTPTGTSLKIPRPVCIRMIPWQKGN
jgi:6-phosphogluconolactonase